MEIDFLEKDKKQPPREPSWKGFVLLLLLTITVLFAFGGVLVMSRLAKKDGGTILTRLSRLLRAGDRPIVGEQEDRINILLFGVGGEGHDGGFLTDSIILASFKPSTGNAALLSLPRDLAIPFPDGTWRKINSVDAYAESADPGNGGETARTSIEKLLHITIPYYVRIDFQGFIQLLDDIGGVTVTVENRLEDPWYPITGKEDAYPIENRYEHLLFEKGVHTMDGQTALKYVRSRRGLGIEGSDFSRVKRQQNVILAAKERIFSWSTLISPVRLSNIVRDLATHIATNIEWNDGLRMMQLMKDINREHIRRIALSDAPESLLTARIANGAYILEPRDGTFTAVRELTQHMLDDESAKLPAPKKKIRVALLNGTTTTGLAKTIGQLLAQQDFIITAVGNAPQKPILQTIIYDMTDKKEFLAYDRLRLLLEAIPPDSTASLPLPAFETPPDFIIILGENTKLP
ncbi:MAG: LCP family protein [bacterium]|nr:LCP family protein [bacterium]